LGGSGTLIPAGFRWSLRKVTIRRAVSQMGIDIDQAAEGPAISCFGL